MRFIILSFIMVCFIACKPALTANTDQSIPVNVDVAQAKALIKTNKNLVLLDVRTSEELQSEGKIDGAIQIDYRDDAFEQNLDNLDKNKHYLVYCKSGGRSSRTVEMMQKKGFKKCTNMEGGFSAWSAK